MARKNKIEVRGVDVTCMTNNGVSRWSIKIFGGEMECPGCHTVVRSGEHHICADGVPSTMPPLTLTPPGIALEVLPLGRRPRARAKRSR